MRVVVIRSSTGRNALVVGPRMAVDSKRVQRIAARLRNINSARQVRAERNINGD